MGTTPLTSTPAGTAERRLLGVTAVAAGVVLVVSACAGPVADAFGGQPDDTASTYPTGTAAKQSAHLPDWVPDDAADVRVKTRPGGSERIVTMRADVASLPTDCVPVSAERPLAPHPVGEGADPADFRSVSTLRADWWPVEQEQAATLICGEWWVGEHEGSLYAFTPERRTVPVG